MSLIQETSLLTSLSLRTLQSFLFSRRYTTFFRTWKHRQKYKMEAVIVVLNIFVLISLSQVLCRGTPINNKLTETEEKILQKYRTFVARKLSEVESTRDFMRIFVQEDNIDTRFVAMVNETVQKKNKGRFFGHGSAVDFDPVLSDQVRDQLQADFDAVRCGEPKPQMIDMYAELGLPPHAGTFLHPSCTRLRRCGSSGCCNTDHDECASIPGTRLNVTKPFIKVIFTNVEHTGRVSTIQQFLNYTLYEDTACSCQRRPEANVPCVNPGCRSPQVFSVSKCGCVCRKRCPAPYVQNTDTCECGCDANSRQCSKVMRGKIALKQGECRCVSHECEMPKCKKKMRFDTTQCKCIQQRSSPSNNNVIPVGRGRMLGAGDASRRVEQPDDQGSGMMITTTTTRVTGFAQSPAPSRVDEDDMTAGVSSSTSEVDVIGENPYPSLALVPVEPERRYYGGLELETETRDAATNSSRSAAVATGASITASADGGGNGDVHTETTSKSYESVDDELGRVSDSRHHYPHHSNLGFEDMEDETTTRPEGEGGSGFQPVDD